jgi:hypothetical protein
MTSSVPPPRTVKVEATDVASGFHCGAPSLDDFFARHALSNDARGIGRTYVLRRSESDPAGMPAVLGYYTLSMSAVSSPLLSRVIEEKLPGYPMPAALIGRLAADDRTRKSGLRVGETLLIDAFARIAAVSDVVGCIGVITDAKNEAAESFYTKYDFITVEETRWPRKMFLPMTTLRAVFDEV